ncbi:9596_t:CDS:1, partial [Racocetra fulgida]
KEIILDGSGPSYNERRHITVSSKPLSEKIPEAIVGNEIHLSTSPEDTLSSLRPSKSHAPRRKVKLGKDENNSESDIGSDVVSVSSKSGRNKKKKSMKSKPKLEKNTSKHRLVEIEKAVAAENDPQLKKKKSLKLRNQSLDMQRHNSTSPVESEIVTSGEDYRRKIEELRNEGGSSWLRVYTEMEYSKDENDRLREPPRK